MIFWRVFIDPQPLFGGSPVHAEPVLFSDAYMKDLQLSSDSWSVAFHYSAEEVKNAFRFYAKNLEPFHFKHRFQRNDISKLDFKEAFMDYVQFHTLEAAENGSKIDVREEDYKFWIKRYHNSLNDVIKVN